MVQKGGIVDFILLQVVLNNWNYHSHIPVINIVWAYLKL